MKKAEYAIVTCSRVKLLLVPSTTSGAQTYAWMGHCSGSDQTECP